MGAFLVHLVGLAVIALWMRLRPRISLGWAFLLWGVGMLLGRLVPSLIARTTAGYDELPSGSARLLAIVTWAGYALVLRALIALTQWDRPETRRLRLFRILALAGIVLIGLFPKASVVFIGISLPALWSFRWRHRLGARSLIAVTFGALLSLTLSMIIVGRNPVDWLGPSPGLSALIQYASATAVIYAIFSMPAAASRIHLSIRTISRRLIGSHALAGAIPFVLGILFLALSTALFLSTYRGTVGANTLIDESKRAGNEIRAEYARAGEIPRLPFGPLVSGQIVLSREADGSVRVIEGAPSFPPASLLGVDDRSQSVPLLWDGRRLYLRARVDSLGSPRHRVEALEPVDSLRMDRLRVMLGVPVRVSPQIGVVSRGGGIEIGPEKGNRQEAALEKLRTGTRDRDSLAADIASLPDSERFVINSIGAAPPSRFSLPGGAIVQCLRFKDGEWSKRAVPVSSSARLGEPIISLFTISRGNPLAQAVIVVLALILALFLGAIWATTSVIVGMGRSVTQAVHALISATRALSRGNLSYRIPVAGNDELWEVAGSFNEMASELEKKAEMERETQRLEEELRLARIIQDRLLPSAPPVVDRVELAGISLPAREVGGDYFDYFILENGSVAIAVADVSGKGAPAALLMSTFRASLRSQDLAMLGPAETLARINRFIHSSIDPGRFITAFLGLLDPATGEFRYANAGHDAPVLVASDGSMRELDGGGLILGLLPHIAYDEAAARIDPGSLIAIFTDGITEARDDKGEFFGTERLVDVLRAVQAQPCQDVQNRVVAAIREFANNTAQSDDITLVLIRKT